MITDEDDNDDDDGGEDGSVSLISISGNPSAIGYSKLDVFRPVHIRLVTLEIYTLSRGTTLTDQRFNVCGTTTLKRNALSQNGYSKGMYT